MASIPTQGAFDKLTSAQMKAELAKHKISLKGLTKKAQFSKAFAEFLVSQEPVQDEKDEIKKSPCDCAKCCPPAHYTPAERKAKCGTAAADSIADSMRETAR